MKKKINNNVLILIVSIFGLFLLLYFFIRLSDSKNFELKKECITMKDQIQKEVNNSLLWKDNLTNTYEYRLIDVFYSPKKNSCLYGVYYTYNEVGYDGVSCGTYVIQDYLEDNEIIEVYSADEFSDSNKKICNFFEASDQYDKKLRRLKCSNIFCRLLSL